MSHIHRLMRFFGFESWFGMLITIPFILYTLLFIFLTVSLMIYENRFFYAPWYGWLQQRGYEVTELSLRVIWWWWIGLTTGVLSVIWLAAILGGDGFNGLRILRSLFQMNGLITPILCTVFLGLRWLFKRYPDLV